jgi:twitching motility two-component system response regulator PilH
MTSSTILVIDDTPTLLDLVKALLEPEGYRVATCLLAREAFARARSLQPDLIILDIVMPEVSGWDVLSQLRADDGLRRIPVVLCTAWAEQAAGHMRQLNQPDLWLLPKPFDADELVDTVTEALATTETAS